MNDDELERLLRESNPARTAVDAPLTASQWARLDAIARQDMPAPSPRPRRRILLAVSTAMAAVLAVVVGIVGVVVTVPGPAVAYGPAPLRYEPIGLTAAEVVAQAVRTAAGSGPVASERHSEQTSWDLSVTDDGTPQQTVAIAPLVRTFEWSADLSGTMLFTAGEPYYADERQDGVPTEGPAAGTVLDEIVFAPGEYQPSIVDPERLTEGEAAEHLALYGADAGDAMTGIVNVLTEWTLTPSQEAALLEALLDWAPQVAGTTTDRAGREVVALTGDDSLGNPATLLLSTATGRIVGMELLAGDDALGVPAGTVISYILWKDIE